MKIRTELADKDEIVIRCRERNSKIRAVEEAIADALRGDSEIVLLGGGREHFVPKSDVLYFESFDGKVYAHTADEVYTAPYKLFELESIMPPTFIRVSKSAIANIGKISSLRRELVGNGEMTFKGCDKKVYFSRAYYKLLQYRINEMRLEK
ncbi:MAG: LytTR family transcriptional regulator [Ruminococcaceae bacterium]|nr:LytTR family transcriptional regulator [Oscillospiraceae bacterium]